MSGIHWVVGKSRLSGQIQRHCCSNVFKLKNKEGGAWPCHLTLPLHLPVFTPLPDYVWVRFVYFELLFYFYSHDMKNSWFRAASGQYYFYFPNGIMDYRVNCFSPAERLWEKLDEEAAAKGWLEWVPERLGTLIWNTFSMIHMGRREQRLC